MAKKLEVRNLTISFRTNNGAVHAVRDVSFDLEEGETLAIAGESGSGKSVTNRAIMGILAGNAVVESGEIIYDGRDLLKIPEEEFHTLRGHKLSMVFQDPLSALNPIMRIGKQLTEAMILNNKERRRDGKKRYDEMRGHLERRMEEAFVEEAGPVPASLPESLAKAWVRKDQWQPGSKANLEPEDTHPRARARRHVRILDAAITTNARLKSDCNIAAEEADNLLDVIHIAEDAIAAGDANRVSAAIHSLVSGSSFLLTDPESAQTIAKLQKYTYTTNAVLDEDMSVQLSDLKQQVQAYAARYSNAEAYALDVPDEYLESVKKAIRRSAEASAKARREAVISLHTALPAFSDPKLDRGACLKYAKEASDAVEKAIDPLDLKKDNQIYVFRSSLVAGLNRYAAGLKQNNKEVKRVAKQTKAYEAGVSAGKFVPSVVPMNAVDMAAAQNTLTRNISSLIDHLNTPVEELSDEELTRRAKDLLEYLRDRAVDRDYVLSKSTARHRAIQLMKEVGIPEPEKRYHQYPFEFSGGMRQRIVIAIALSANPDILICDEPTTALDVTIQAQILELINNLKKERNLSVIFITHDLGVVANMADKIAIMYAGKIVEYGTADDVFYDPRHPYTWALLSSMPDLETKEKLSAIPGTPPNMILPPKGDAFAERNQFALEIDFEEQPPAFQISPTHWAATWLLHPNAPKVEPPAIVTERIQRMLAASDSRAQEDKQQATVRLEKTPEVEAEDDAEITDEPDEFDDLDDLDNAVEADVREEAEPVEDEPEEAEDAEEPEEPEEPGESEESVDFEDDDDLDEDEDLGDDDEPEDEAEDEDDPDEDDLDEDVDLDEDFELNQDEVPEEDDEADEPDEPAEAEQPASPEDEPAPAETSRRFFPESLEDLPLLRAVGGIEVRPASSDPASVNADPVTFAVIGKDVFLRQDRRIIGSVKKRSDAAELADWVHSGSKVTGCVSAENGTLTLSAALYGDPLAEAAREQLEPVKLRGTRAEEIQAVLPGLKAGSPCSVSFVSGTGKKAGVWQVTCGGQTIGRLDEEEYTGGTVVLAEVRESKKDENGLKPYVYILSASQPLPLGEDRKEGGDRA